jgi:hypothetical protein
MVKQRFRTIWTLVIIWNQYLVKAVLKCNQNLVKVSNQMTDNQLQVISVKELVGTQTIQIIKGPVLATSKVRPNRINMEQLMPPHCCRMNRRLMMVVTNKITSLMAEGWIRKLVTKIRTYLTFQTLAWSAVQSWMRVEWWEFVALE